MVELTKGQRDIISADLLFVLGYISAKEENEDTKFEGTESLSIRKALKLVDDICAENEDIKG